MQEDGLLLVINCVFFNNRVCIQWGRVNNIPTFSSKMNTKFPITFTRSCVSILYFSNFSSDQIIDIFKGNTSIGSLSKSQFTISTDTLNGGNWIAIGY